MDDLIGAVRESQRIFRQLRVKIARLRTTHVNKIDLLNELRSSVDGYFRTERPLLLRELRREDFFGSLDALLQELLRLAQTRSARSRYLSVLAKIEQEWREFEVRAMPLAREMAGSEDLSARQRALSTTLERICPASDKCYKQALADIRDPSRISWRGTASELREALRELLDTLAPDEAVVASPGFKLEAGARAPTMKQKTRFILRSRRWSEAARKPVEEAADIVEEKVGGFVRSVYSGSSASVHTSRDKKEVLSLLRFVETSLSELLELEPG